MSAQIVKHLVHSWSSLLLNNWSLKNLDSPATPRKLVRTAQDVGAGSIKAHDVVQPGMIGGLFHVELGTVNF